MIEESPQDLIRNTAQVEAIFYSYFGSIKFNATKLCYFHSGGVNLSKWLFKKRLQVLSWDGLDGGLVKTNVLMDRQK